jgi:Arc/MetJ family transcription regulator
VYDRCVTKRTNINLDTELLREAAELLGTERITDTVHAAMREVVDREYRRRLANRRLFTDVTPQELEAMRRGRTFES